MRLLIIRLSALGDVVTASPVARVIKEAVPTVELVWAVEQRCADAVVGNPFVDEVLVLPSSRQWGKWLGAGQLQQAGAAAGELGRRLRARRFDAVVDLQGLFKSAALAAAARADRVILPAGASERLPLLRAEVTPRRVDPAHIATMYTSLLQPLGITPRAPESLRLIMPVGDPARAAMTAWRAARGLAVQGYVACAPGTTRPQKMWRDDAWAPLLERLHEEHGLPAVLLGGPTERDLNAAIARAMRTPVHDATAATSLKETGALLESARLTVSVDTGPMHMAVAVGCPTVALFGSTAPRLFGDARYVCLHRQLACSPCNRHPICRAYECMSAIRVEDVARAAAALLQ